MATIRALLAILLLCFISPAFSRPAIVFSCPIPNSLPQWQDLVGVFTEAFDRLGYDFSMHHLNGKRELYKHKNSDTYDGTCIRLKSFAGTSDEYKLIIINAQVGDPYTSVWRNKATTRKPNGTDATQFQKNSTAGHLRSSSLSEKFIQGFPDVNSASFLRPDLGIKTLAAGRIDYWVGYAFTADYLAEKLQLHESIEKMGNVRQDHFYPYINKRHAELKQPLEQEILRIMHRRGSLIR